MTEVLKLYRELPAPIRAQIVEGLSKERVEEGWDLPHYLGFVSITHMGMIDQGEMVGLSTVPFPIPLEAIDSDHVWAKVERIAEGTMAAFRSGLFPPLPENCAGLILMAESWALFGEDVGTGMPSESPKRVECLQTVFVDFSGHVTSLMQVRDGESKLFDLDDLDPKDRASTLEGSRLFPPLMVMAMVMAMAAAPDVMTQEVTKRLEELLRS